MDNPCTITLKTWYHYLSKALSGHAQQEQEIPIKMLLAAGTALRVTGSPISA